MAAAALVVEVVDVVAADEVVVEDGVDGVAAEEPEPADPLEVAGDVLLDVVPVPFGGSTETPPEAAALLPLEAGALDDVALGAVEVPAEPLGALVPAALPDVLVPEDVAEEDGVVVDVDGDVAEGAALCVWAGGVLVRVPCPTGKNEPPVINVAMMPAITATRAMPISRSGQLRRNQSMIPF